MKWKLKDGNSHIGRKGGFKFRISLRVCRESFYVVAHHKKKDIRFNTLWEYLDFYNLESAKKFCEEFDYRQHNCLGNDFKLPYKVEYKDLYTYEQLFDICKTIVEKATANDVDEDWLSSEINEWLHLSTIRIDKLMLTDEKVVVQKTKKI